ncbi:hypothetical protein EVAR_11264_1 [Eumeta japonica]|uniref:Uncharacterized protein n=1 Tax=Eumeta variegata TaxID=151549 RepID=A0A4C1UL25_EUMVA|nr:hypothetical protein EVAR_11264_1 [Eumeta japonica]
MIDEATIFLQLEAAYEEIASIGNKLLVAVEGGKITSTLYIFHYEIFVRLAANVKIHLKALSCGVISRERIAYISRSYRTRRLRIIHLSLVSRPKYDPSSGTRRAPITREPVPPQKAPWTPHYDETFADCLLQKRSVQY